MPIYHDSILNCQQRFPDIEIQKKFVYFCILNTLKPYDATGTKIPYFSYTHIVMSHCEKLCSTEMFFVASLIIIGLYTTTSPTVKEKREVEPTE